MNNAKRTEEKIDYTQVWIIIDSTVSSYIFFGNIEEAKKTIYDVKGYKYIPLHEYIIDDNGRGTVDSHGDNSIKVWKDKLAKIGPKDPTKPTDA